MLTPHLRAAIDRMYKPAGRAVTHHRAEGRPIKEVTSSLRLFDFGFGAAVVPLFQAILVVLFEYRKRQ